MRLKKMIHGFNGSVPVRPEALPRFYPGDNRGVLLIHGYTGFPEEMDFLGRELNKKGFTVSIPRLPGHGTGRSDFQRSDAAQWLRRSLDAYMDLCALCGETGTVDIVGLSMGGLLAILLSSIKPPRKLVLAAPAIATSKPLLPFTPFLRFFIREIRRNNQDLLKTAPQPDKETDYYSLYTSVIQAAEFYGLQRLSLRLLPRLEIPCLAIFSKKDKTVPLKALSILEKRGNFSIFKKLVLEESGHVVLNDSQKEAAALGILEFLLKAPL